MATYVFIEGDNMIPINRYVNVGKFMSTMQKIYEDAKAGKNKKAKMRLLGLLRHIKFGRLRKYLLPIVKSDSYDYLGDLHRKMLLVSSIHFMGPYNFDLERVQNFQLIQNFFTQKLMEINYDGVIGVAEFKKVYDDLMPIQKSKLKNLCGEQFQRLMNHGSIVCVGIGIS